MDTLRRKLVELHVFQQVNAVHHQHDLVDGKRDVRIGVGRHLDRKIVSPDQHRVLLGQPLGRGDADAGTALGIPGVVLAPELAPAGVEDRGIAALQL